MPGSKGAGLEQHLHKTYFGNIEHGFNWFGYHFNTEGLQSMAKQVVVNFHSNIHRLRLKAPTFGMSKRADCVSQLSRRSSGWWSIPSAGDVEPAQGLLRQIN